MKRLFLIFLCVGCAEIETVDMPEGWDSGTTAAISLPTRGSHRIDAGTPDMLEATRAFEGERPESFDVLPIRNCVQRAIDNEYVSCPSSDPYAASCAACEGFESRCKAAIDCLLEQPTACDETCIQKCVGSPDSSNVRFCVYKVVTPFCGVQPWSNGVAWGCTKAL